VLASSVGAINAQNQFITVQSPAGKAVGAIRSVSPDGTKATGLGD